MKRLEAVARGYVQGVGYRAFVVREARLLDVTGWVRNEADGSVRVVAEGEEGSLLDLLRSLRRGPSEAEVLNVEAFWRPAVGEFSGFRVLG
jgi:acylphosphatase